MNQSMWLILVTAIYLGGPDPAWSQANPLPLVVERTWPAPFELHGPQVGMFGFVSTQAGPIVVDVQAQGAPVSVRLDGPMAQPLQQQGSGVLHLTHTVSPQELQSGILWHITIQLLPSPAAQAAVATGNVKVQHPPANPQLAQQFIAAQRAQQPPPPTDQQRAQLVARLLPARQAAHQQRLAAAENELTQRRNVIVGTLQPQLGAMPPKQPTTGVTTRSLEPIAAIRRPIPPQVSNISAAEGVPGDGIMIYGTGFGTTPGQVHFVIGPNPSQDLVSSAVQWTGGQIFAAVPDPSMPDPSVGAAPYQGVMYVLTAGGKSTPIPFKFDPIIDHRWITVPADYLLSTNGSWNKFVQDGALTQVAHEDFGDMSSKSGVDNFFGHAYLQNGWTVESQPNVNITYQAGPAGVGPAIARIGSNSPALSVFWWVGWNPSWENWIYYTIEIPIKGPRGLPDGIVCVSKPAPQQACPYSQ